MHTCPNCGGGELKIIAAILERPVIEKILTHLGLSPDTNSPVDCLCLRRARPRAGRGLQGWTRSHRLGGGRARWCRTEAAPPEPRLARAGLDRHRLRRPQRRLRPGDAARPVGVALPDEGQP